MDVICNGKKKEVMPGTTIADFIREYGLDPQNTAVECDGNILESHGLEKIILQDGMVLELIRFVGGGGSC